MSKHTPGPWEYSTTQHTLVGSNGRPVRFYGEGITIAMGGAEDEDRANWRMAKAAPEMYEALKEAESLVIGWAVHHAIQGCTTEREYEAASQASGWHPTHRQIYEKVKAALAKAEGRERA